LSATTASRPDSGSASAAVALERHSTCSHAAAG
jgi:hypothetical protein